MPLIVPLISCFYANQTFLGLDGLVNNTPSRPICHRRASSWRQLVPTDWYRQAQRPGPGLLPPPPATVPLELPQGLRSHFTEGETEATTSCAH